MHRFFVPAEWINPREVDFQGQVARQIFTVLRLRPGERVCVLDNSGWEMEAELTEVSRESVVGKITRRRLAASEPRVKVTVFQSMLKYDRFEFVLQKCTELGATGFVPLITARTIIGSVGDVDTHRYERWQRIILEAAEQSGRGRLPSLQPAELFPSAIERISELSFIPWEGETALSLRGALRRHFPDPTGTAGSIGRPFSVSIFVGPEGGFTAREVDLARRYGLLPVTLGPRVLRAETAAVATTAAVLYEAGDLGA